jgi:hypothetical protein
MTHHLGEEERQLEIVSTTQIKQMAAKIQHLKHTRGQHSFLKPNISISKQVKIKVGQPLPVAKTLPDSGGNPTKQPNFSKEKINLRIKCFVEKINPRGM